MKKSRCRVNSEAGGAEELRVLALCGTRTHDLGIRNPLLYPAELRAHLMANPDLTASVIRDGTLRESSGKSRLRIAPIAEEPVRQ